MSPTQSTRYLWLVIGLIAFALLAIVGLNLVADPFRVFGVPRRIGFNHQLPNTFGFSHQTKPYEVLHRAPRTVLVGSSTAHSGFLDLADWKLPLPQPAYNYALFGANAHEACLSLAQTVRECPVELVIMVADFFAYNAQYLDNERFSIERLASATRQRWPGFMGSDLAAFTLGKEALKFSRETVSGSCRSAQAQPGGSPWWASHPWRTVFREMERSYLARWFPPPDHRYEFASPQTGRDRMADFESALQLCADRKIRLIVLCPPIHARFQEAIATAGAWPFYESWKQELTTRVRARQSLSLGSGTVELWDFSLWNESTCEALPADGCGPMRNFFDSAHFTPDFGKRILEEILEGETADSSRLGVRLDRVNLETHLASIRSGLEQFRAAEPAVVADVRDAMGTTYSDGLPRP